MTKALILKVFSCLFLTATAVAVVCAIYVRDGSGFIDMTNIVRGFFVGVAVILALISFLLRKWSERRK